MVVGWFRKLWSGIQSLFSRLTGAGDDGVNRKTRENRRGQIGIVDEYVPAADGGGEYEEDDDEYDEDTRRFLSAPVAFIDRERVAKRKEFWSCGRRGIWRKPVAILWYISLLYMTYAFVRFYVGPWSTDARIEVVEQLHGIADTIPFSDSGHAALRNAAIESGWASWENYNFAGYWVGASKETAAAASFDGYIPGIDAFEDYYHLQQQ